jgi:hypothetical protein
MDKRERQVVKTLRETKPISDKEYQEQKKAKAEHDKWIEDLRKNYPGICFDYRDGIAVVVEIKTGLSYVEAYE